MEAHTTATLSDVTPTGSRTQVITPEEIPEQVIYIAYEFFQLNQCCFS